MAIILQYRRPAEPAPRTAELGDGALGEVVIFPGVRIDRRAVEEAPGGGLVTSRKAPQRSRKKQRR